MSAVATPPVLKPSHVPAENEAPQPIAIPGAHELIFKVAQRHIAQGTHVLDLGAGQGNFSQMLFDGGYKVAACDLYPEMFRCPAVECRQADAEQPLPYEDETFDAVVALELVEHLETQLGLFRDVARMLKPGGVFLFSTPNIASLKSRFRFLFTGYMYSHPPLDPKVHDPVCQHVAPFTPDRYQFMLARAGLELTHVEADKYQKSSLGLSWLSPLVRWCARTRYGTASGVRMQNCPAALLGRTMIGIARKG
jgi:2-polyprenyl-3-methyl-5-hydroxy-6-metoxy-1,4-benzoquinol methylase